MDILIPYWRFSDPSQEDGDSFRRQDSFLMAYCQRTGSSVDPTWQFRDKGVSAFLHKNAEKGDLARFLSEVEEGRIPTDRVLVVENIDRLTRGKFWKAVGLMGRILDTGIRILTLWPREYLLTADDDLEDVLPTLLEQRRGHSESVGKHVRNGNVWESKIQRASEGKEPLTHRVPEWIDPTSWPFKAIPERARMIRKMFQLCIDGYGVDLIVKQLNIDGEACWARSGKWNMQYVRKILRGRMVRGEFPGKKGATAGAELWTKYYEEIVSEETWQAAQRALNGRRNRPGRRGEKVAQLFTGLLMDARTQGPMHIAWQTHGQPPNQARIRAETGRSEGEGGRVYLLASR